MSKLRDSVNADAQQARCKLSEIAAQLASDDRTELSVLLRDPTVRHVSIARALREVFGKEISEASIRRCRASGTCGVIYGETSRKGRGT